MLLLLYKTLSSLESKYLKFCSSKISLGLICIKSVAMVYHLIIWSRVFSMTERQSWNSPQESMADLDLDLVTD